MLNGFVATKIVVDAVFAVTGNNGPDIPGDPNNPAASFSRIQKATNLGDTTVQDFNNISGLRLNMFAAADNQAVASELDDIWAACVSGAQQVWSTARPDQPFNPATFVAPTPYDGDSSLSHLAHQLIICLGL